MGEPVPGPPTEPESVTPSSTARENPPATARRAPWGQQPVSLQRATATRNKREGAEANTPGAGRQPTRPDSGWMGWDGMGLGRPACLPALAGPSPSFQRAQSSRQPTRSGTRAAGCRRLGDTRGRGIYPQGLKLEGGR